MSSFSMIDRLAFFLAQRIHYISTYCLDGLHDQCRLRCKNCRKLCRCPYCKHRDYQPLWDAA